MVPKVGLEPTRYRYQRILSPSRLPIPSFRLDSIHTLTHTPIENQVFQQFKICRPAYKPGGRFQSRYLLHFKISQTS